MSRRTGRRRAGPQRTETANQPRAGEPNADAPSRRSFLAGTWIALSVVALAEAFWVALSFVWPRRDGTTATAIVAAGPEESFAPGSVTAFPHGRFYLVRLDDGGFLALDRRCTHLGCTVPWDREGERFACPCHASSFDIRGDVLGPPAPRPLDLFPVRIENGIVKIDTSQSHRRSSFEPSQVTRS